MGETANRGEAAIAPRSGGQGGRESSTGTATLTREMAGGMERERPVKLEKKE